MAFKQKPGFSLIELLFAITVLGVMLSIVLNVVVGMLRFYTFSNKIRENQQNGRNVLDSMVRDIRSGRLVLPATEQPNNQSRLCIADEKSKKLTVYSIVDPNKPEASLGRTQYSYLDQELENVRACDGSGGAVVIGNPVARMTSRDMTITGFNVNRIAGAPGTSKERGSAVAITLQYGTGSLKADGSCSAGDIFCATLNLTTAVNMRGGR